ncbi:MAG: cysteine desulfurase [Phycisphaeraceae bacterium]|nr:cysteine desulfurase [Phycisphaeraceae bacterium]
MSTAMIYLDSNATTRPTPAVVEAVSGALTEGWCNPSSLHRPGQIAKMQMERARTQIAQLIHAKPRDITFTSGGTEACDLAIRGLLGAAEGRRVVVTSPVEHSAVRELCKRLSACGEIEIRTAPINRFGQVHPEGLASLLDDAVALVSIQWANNENGAVQPVQAIGAMCKERGIPFHVDATQWVGKEVTDVSSNWCDVLTFSSHKFHGPKGVGMAWISRHARIKPCIAGQQELGRRGGTENVPGIVGAGVAAAECSAWLADPANKQRAEAVRDAFERGILEAIPDAVLNSPTEPGSRIWNTANIGFPGLESEALLILLSERGVCASAGAACSSGALEPSAVLLAMGVPYDVAHGSVRFSTCRETTHEQAAEAVRIVTAVVAQLRQSWAHVQRA